MAVSDQAKRKSKMTPGNIAYAVLILLLVVLVLYLLIARMTGNIPTFFGYSVVRIVTGSMEPKIPVGSFVLIKRIAPGEVGEGDIITFYTDDPDPAIAGMTVTHRVLSVETTEDGKLVFRTKGDNNPVPDVYPATGEGLVGRYVCGALPLTAIVTLFRTHLPIALLVTVLIPMIVLTQNGIRKRMKALSSEREEHIRQRVAEELARLKEKQNENTNRPDDGNHQP
ncbi:MAG: signal peptidase I [Clostridia bacterium]|nr:signal peptidase I [Clostridia bacterium]